MWTVKQKIVLVIDMACEKCKTNAKRIIAETKGVTLLEIKGDERAVVIGVGIDTATLIVSLRKRIKKEVHVVSIEEVKQESENNGKEKKVKKEKEEENNKKNVTFWLGYPYCGYNYNYPFYPPPPLPNPPPCYDVVCWDNSMFPNTWGKW